MTDTTARVPDAAGETDQSGPDDPAREAASAPEPPDARISDAAALTAEVAELKDKLLRTLAEMENLRRRTEREVADARVYGVTAFARDMLSVADNMRRALEAVGPEMREDADAGVKALIEGIELTERELLNGLERYGVKKLDPIGQKFDPHFHQAMFEIPDPNSAPGTIAQVVQPGYTIGERVLRPAMVGVTKGGPKPSGSSNGSSQSKDDIDDAP